jgi:dTDP-4-dehydrorhamnose reductase
MPLMFGESGPVASSWLQDLLKSMRNNQEIKLFTDEYRTPVSGTTAAKGLLLMLEKNYKGIIHLGGKESISRFDFGLMVKDIFKFHDANIVPIKQAEIKMDAPRPANVCLNSSKAFALGYNPLSLREELQNCFVTCK